MRLRIHSNHLSQGVKRKLYNEISQVKDWKFTPYSLDKIQKRGIKTKSLSKAIIEGKLIEYNIKDNTRRVLLRCKDGTCAVVDLDGGSIITAYKNHPAYDHPNLDIRKYLFGV